MEAGGLMKSVGHRLKTATKATIVAKKAHKAPVRNTGKKLDGEIYMGLKYEGVAFWGKGQMKGHHSLINDHEPLSSSSFFQRSFIRTSIYL